VVNPLPNARIIGDSVLCGDRTATLTATGGGTYLWEGGNHSPTVTISIPKTYKVAVTSAAGCVKAASISIGQAARPTAQFTAILKGGQVSFTNVSIGATSLVWNFGNGQTSTVENPSMTYNQNGSYSVRLVVKNGMGCTDTIAQTINITRVGNEEVSSKPRVKVGPNPTWGWLNVEVLNRTTSYQLKVTNAIGQVLFTKQVFENSIELDLSDQPDGAYFLNIVHEGGQKVVPFVLRK
jgi:PKD repeat protein